MSAAADSPYADWSDGEYDGVQRGGPSSPSIGGLPPHDPDDDGFVLDDEGSGSSGGSDLDAQINQLYTQHREQQKQQQVRSGRGPARPETASRTRPSSGISRSGDLDDEDEEALRREEERRMQERERERERENAEREAGENAQRERENAEREREKELERERERRREEEEKEKEKENDRRRKAEEAEAERERRRARQEQEEREEAARVQREEREERQRRAHLEQQQQQEKLRQQRKMQQEEEQVREQEQRRDQARPRPVMGLDGRLVDSTGHHGGHQQQVLHPRPPSSSTGRRHQQQQRPMSSRPSSSASQASSVSRSSRPSTAGTSRGGLDTSADSDYQDPRLRSSLRIALEAERDRKVKKGRAKAVAEEQRRVEWDCLKKLEFANEWSAALGDTKTYRAFKGTQKGAVMMVHVYQNSLKIRELTLDMFEKRYQRIKAKYDDEASRSRQISLPTKLSAEEYRVQSKQSIRKVLLDTVQLISKLQGQVRSLRAKGGSFTPYVSKK